MHTREAQVHLRRMFVTFTLRAFALVPMHAHAHAHEHTSHEHTSPLHSYTHAIQRPSLHLRK